MSKTMVFDIPDGKYLDCAMCGYKIFNHTDFKIKKIKGVYGEYCPICGKNDCFIERNIGEIGFVTKL